jgi:uncharacterized protein (UPF0212 family)
MESVRIGKAKIDVIGRGCIGCGTEFSSAWTVAKIVQVEVEGRRLEIRLYRCRNCSAKSNTQEKTR